MTVDAEPVATPIVGGSGTVTAGTAVFESAEGALVPIALVAVTTHLYDAPFVSGETTIGLDAADALPAAPEPDVHDAV